MLETKDVYFYELNNVFELLNLSVFSFWFCLASIAFAPIFWNIVGELEYHKKILSRFVGPKIGCYILATCIFLLQIERDIAFSNALLDQYCLIDISSNLYFNLIAQALIVIGTIFVLSSFFKLGITGTYLGDHFGILFDEKIESFPFNVLENPMYVGSVLNFLGASILKGSVAGIIISIYIHIVYRISVDFFEGPFTTMIYTRASNEKKENAKEK
eukprot:TRINITY_DN945_c0_g1_i2.p1 TRINITY_DN945_c0_g1~~TRINITY_DN945_c0_g1_i2.p1  ORF type:complete len:215 (-),score=28.09 TRINITY_DN945_c0_g1_i2:142-786(-)